jgi:hypothetical protein
LGSGAWLKLGAIKPVDQEQGAYQEQRTSYQEVSGPPELPPGHDHIPYSEGHEQNRADPLPTPRDSEGNQKDTGWDEVHEQGNDRFPEAIACAEHIESEDANEHGKQKAYNPGHPEHYRFYGLLHGDHLLVLQAIPVYSPYYHISTPRSIPLKQRRSGGLTTTSTLLKIVA